MRASFLDRGGECTVIAPWLITMIVTVKIPKGRTVGHSLKEMVV